MGSLFADRTFRTALRAGLAVLVLVGAVFLLYRAWAIVQPLLIAVVLATALWPLVSRISSTPIGPKRWRVPRFLAAALIHVSTIVTVGLVLWSALSIVLPNGERLLESYPTNTQFIADYLEPFRDGDIAAGASKVAGNVAKEASKPNGGNAGQGEDNDAVSANIGTVALRLVGGLWTLVLVLIFSFFLLLDGARFAQWALLLLPKNRRIHARVVGQEVRDRVSSWVLAQAVYGIVSGIIVGTAMWLMQLPSPWLYGVLGAVLAVLPGIGPAVATVPAIFATLGLSTWQPIAVAVFAGALTVVDGTFIAPRIYGGVMRLPAMVMLLALLLGAAWMGVWGALIAAPVAVAIHSLVREQIGRGPGSSTG